AVSLGDLHSFPTRRSSDLATARIERWPLAVRGGDCAASVAGSATRAHSRVNARQRSPRCPGGPRSRKCGSRGAAGRGRSAALRGAPLSRRRNGVMLTQSRCPTSTVSEAAADDRCASPPPARPLPGPHLPVVGPARDPRTQGGSQREEADPERSEEHTSELQSRENLVCRLLLEKK